MERGATGILFPSANVAAPMAGPAIDLGAVGQFTVLLQGTLQGTVEPQGSVDGVTWYNHRFWRDDTVVPAYAYIWAAAAGLPRVLFVSDGDEWPRSHSYSHWRLVVTAVTTPGTLEGTFAAI